MCNSAINKIPNFKYLVETTDVCSHLSEDTFPTMSFAVNSISEILTVLDDYKVNGSITVNDEEVTIDELQRMDAILNKFNNGKKL